MSFITLMLSKDDFLSCGRGELARDGIRKKPIARATLRIDMEKSLIRFLLELVYAFFEAEMPLKLKSAAEFVRPIFSLSRSEICSASNHVHASSTVSNG